MTNDDRTSFAQSLLDAERERESPPTDVERRVLARVHTTLALPERSMAGALYNDAEQTRQRRRGDRPRLWAMIALLLRPLPLAAFGTGASLGVTTVVIIKHVNQQRSVVPRRAAAPPTQKTKPSTAAPPTTRPAANRPASRPTQIERSPGKQHLRKTTTRQPQRMTSVTAREEAQLIEMASNAMARGRNSAALAALRSHRGRYPKGVYAEERDALTIMVLAALQRPNQAKRELVRFRKRYRDSLFLDKIVRALQDARARP